MFIYYINKMSQINNTILNNSTNNYNVFLLIKTNMINGELSINDLSSKNRALLHRICADFGLEHYSTGSYNNRVFVIKDSQHTYFTNTTNDNYWENYLNNLNEYNPQSYTINNTQPLVEYNDKEYSEEEDDDKEYSEEEDDDKEYSEEEDDDKEYSEEEDVKKEYSEEEDDDKEYSEEEDDDNIKECDTDTYSSNSNSNSSNSTCSVSNSSSVYLINKMNNQDMMLKYIYVLTFANLIVNTYLMFTI